MKRKTFRLPEQIARVVPNMGSCLASDRVTVEGLRVGSMVREPSDRADDSGWVFLAGDESQAYLDDPPAPGDRDHQVALLRMVWIRARPAISNELLST